VLDVVVLAIALAMDATAVAAARGVAGIARAEALRIALAFGGVQAGMAAIGWAAGVTAVRWIETWDHWVAFGLLAAIGGKMLVEGVRGEEREEVSATLSWRALLVLAIATSIDALAAGVTLPVLAAPIAVSLVLIGAVTFALALIGALAGRAIGERIGRGLEIAGGVALIAIGVKTLIEHMT
jgi:manganese efflux pump family protein